MSDINKKFIEELAELEYVFRDGLHLSPEQWKEVALIAKNVLKNAEEEI